MLQTSLEFVAALSVQRVFPRAAQSRRGAL